MAKTQLALALVLFATLAHCQLKEGEAERLLKKHNELRAKVAAGGVKDKNGKLLPPAGDMRKMEWDEELAAKAQAWVEQCSEKHEPKETLGFVGENLAMASVRDVDTMVQDWFNEIVDEDYEGDFTQAFNGDAGKHYDIGHFTQVVWAKSVKLGCGITFCTTNNWYVLLCRYSPSGNVDGGYPVYAKADKPCAQCADSCEADLCTKSVGSDEGPTGGFGAGASDAGEKCGADLGTDCPDWYCLTGVPKGVCTVDGNSVSYRSA